MPTRRGSPRPSSRISSPSSCATRPARSRPARWGFPSSATGRSSPAASTAAGKPRVNKSDTPMPSLADKYYDRAASLLATAREKNTPVIAKVAPLIGASIAKGGILHTFGSGHSEVISREIIGRAGGLVCVSGIIDPTNGFIENLPGYGEKLVARHDRQYQLLAGEVIIVISN